MSIVIELLAASLVLAQVEPLKVFNAKFVELRKLEKDKISLEQNTNESSTTKSKLKVHYPNAKEQIFLSGLIVLAQRHFMEEKPMWANMKWEYLTGKEP